MKIISYILLAVVVTMLAGCAPKVIITDDSSHTLPNLDKVVDANNQFAFDMYSQAETGKNIFFSPYSISTAMAIVHEGAAGETSQEIENVFHYPSGIQKKYEYAFIHNSLNKNGNPYKLYTANALWAEKTYSFLPEYINTIETFYGGEATNKDFINNADDSRKDINNWVESHTNNKIENLFVEGSLTSDTKLAITNTVYFKGDWENKFQKSKTKDSQFYLSYDHAISTKMMLHATDKNLNYFSNDDVQVVELPYKGNDISMIVMLPRENHIGNFEKILTIENYNLWTKDMKPQLLRVHFPKFKFNTKFGLEKTLSDMGMPSVFKPGIADLSRMDGSKNLYISTAVHQAYVDVDEEGTEAVAATGIGVKATGISSYIDFNADHPFIFVIKDKTTGLILFMGKIMNPSV